MLWTQLLRIGWKNPYWTRLMTRLARSPSPTVLNIEKSLIQPKIKWVSLPKDGHGQKSISERENTQTMSVRVINELNM